jgi:Tfp pilus assembly protein PilN
MITVNLKPGARRVAKPSGPAFGGLITKLKGLTSGTRDPMQLVGIGSLAAVVLGLGGMWALSSSKLATLEPQLEEVRAEHDRYQGFIRQKRREERVRDSILTQIGTIAAVDRDRFVWPHLLDEIAGALPDYTWLISVASVAAPPVVTDSTEAPPPVSVSIKGRTGDLQNYTAFLRRLEASPWLANVQAIEAKTVIVANRALTEFTVQAAFEHADSTQVRTVPILESVVED